MKKLLAIAGGSTLVFVVLALVMGVIPGYELSQTPAGPNVRPLTPIEAEGREVYVANGCSYCHTQQVRPLDEDRVFGRPSAPGDFAYQTPELLGSERTGPDLTNVGVRQASEVWQYLHLYNPRVVVPESIMPSFGWMFSIVDKVPAGLAPVPLPAGSGPAHGVVVPTQQATALVAYVLSLKQPLLPGAMGGMSPSSGPKPGVAGAAAQAERGKQLFSTNCSSCHQATGAGLPGAFPPLKGDPIVNDPDPTSHIHTVLFGLQGATIGGAQYSSPMPPFGGQLNDKDVADLIDYERSAWANHGKPVKETDVAAVRAKGK
jgi:cytochrome c oxidase cbb3-type subunit II